MAFLHLMNCTQTATFHHNLIFITILADSALL